MIEDRPEDWHPAAFVTGSILSVVLLVSWFVEPTRSFWLAIDLQFFRATNDTLAWGRPWQTLWAVANIRAVDLLSALSMVGLYAHYGFRRGREQLGRFLAVGLMIASLLVVAKRFADALSTVHRRSPTLLYDDAYRLSELAPWISTKDTAVDSFPGDHCMVLIICAGIISFYLPRAWSAIAWIFAVLFSVPRLMSGAHWLSDNLVGSVAIAGFLLTWVLATPLHSVISDWFERFLHRFRRLFAPDPDSFSMEDDEG